MQDHHLNLCIVFIIIIFIAPSHKENSIVMVYRSPKTFFCLFGTLSVIFFFFCVFSVFFLCNVLPYIDS